MEPEVLASQVEEAAATISAILSLAEDKINNSLENFIDKELSPVLGMAAWQTDKKASHVIIYFAYVYFVSNIFFFIWAGTKCRIGSLS